ncbi:hypothetical protein U9M48_016484 [Paspalum notatum var. saurae]|uniref:F-box domain-containing protein n=1 Tax=Paspalum notatum var. saurae TaxID=547442 RepID=A0AAQ3WMW1_PASNO
MEQPTSSSPASLPEDIVVDILSRLPVASLCRCKCVCRRWRHLIVHPEHRRRLVQTLSGFFSHLSLDDDAAAVYPPPWRFTASSALEPPHAVAVDTAFSFLPSSYLSNDTELLDSCNGLLLLRCCRASSSSWSRHLVLASYVYVVCNPATEQWVELPAPRHAPGAFGLRSDRLAGRRRTRTAALAFDPADASSPARFHVLQLVERETIYPSLLWPAHCFVVAAVEIYSSQTRSWDLADCSEWSDLPCTGQAAYHDGSLHFTTGDGAVLSVDTQAQEFRVTRVMPARSVFGGAGCFVGRSRGRLLYVHTGSTSPSMSVYALETRQGRRERWVIRHYADAVGQFGKTLFKENYGVVAIHPDGNVIFLFDGSRGILMAYDMGRRTVRDVQHLAGSSPYYPFFPYIPLYSSETLT